MSHMSRTLSCRFGELLAGQFASQTFRWVIFRLFVEFVAILLVSGATIMTDDWLHDYHVENMKQVVFDCWVQCFVGEGVHFDLSQSDYVLRFIGGQINNDVRRSLSCRVIEQVIIM